MVRIKASVIKNNSTSSLSCSAIGNSSSSSSPKSIPKKDMVAASNVAGLDQLYESDPSSTLPNASKAVNTGTNNSLSPGCSRSTDTHRPPSHGKRSSRRHSTTRSRSLSAASLSRSNIINAASVPKCRSQSNRQRSRSASAATRRKATSGATSSRSRSAPASRRRATDRTRASFKTIVRKIAKAVDRRSRLSPMAVRVLDSFVNDILRRLAVELKRLCEQTGQRAISTDDVRFAIGLLLTGDLLLHAKDEGDRAVALYRLDRQ
uniref:Histone H2A/H2B/H3 domain-containing protein n=1 Tax=Plectus sambesii TaxID=2011161 RepID=A0A914X2Y6_9BILA